MALNAQQSRIEHSDGGSPPTFTEIEEVVSISGPTGTAGTTDATHLRSSAIETLPKLPDYGEVTLDCNLVYGAQQIALFAMFSSNADPERFRMRLPSNATATAFHTFEFDAAVTAWQVRAPVNDKQGLSMTLKISGPVAYTPPGP